MVITRRLLHLDGAPRVNPEVGYVLDLGEELCAIGRFVPE
jgi:hypothetical protein